MLTLSSEPGQLLHRRLYRIRCALKLHLRYGLHREIVCYSFDAFGIRG